MKRIAIFLDGTWDTLDNNTNVWRLKSLCDPEATDQLVYYSQGVGTAFGQRLIGGITGYGIDQEIIDAYAWLTGLFEAGDDLFIFGFSRGAYTARSLSGLIATCGVLQPGAPLSLQQLYARYRRRTDRTLHELLGATNDSGFSLEDRWLVKYCTATSIKMVGVWETVGALGNPLAPMKEKIAKFRFLDTHLRLQNEFAFQALAMDEQRKGFEPTFWTRTVANNPTTPPPPERTLAQVEQRWFVGAHGNVGGGYPSDVLAQLPLKWIMDKASALGLRLRNSFEMDGQSAFAPITDSYKQAQSALVRLFSHRYYRPVGPEPDRGSTMTTSRINETIDESVFARWRGNPEYRPPNLADWATRRKADPAAVAGSCLALDPAVAVR
jgi:uncharacterized protein (DUF2235 family)